MLSRVNIKKEEEEEDEVIHHRPYINTHKKTTREGVDILISLPSIVLSRRKSRPNERPSDDEIPRKKKGKQERNLVVVCLL